MTEIIYSTVVAEDGSVSRVALSAEDAAALQAKWTEFAARNLEIAKATAITKINTEAEKERQKYITPGDGQMLVYYRKSEEAKSLLAKVAADANYVPDVTEFPMIGSGIGRDGATLLEVAQLISGLDQQWVVIASAIDSLRRTLVDNTKAAATIGQIKILTTDIAWPSF